MAQVTSLGTVAANLRTVAGKLRKVPAKLGTVAVNKFVFKMFNGVFPIQNQTGILSY